MSNSMGQMAEESFVKEFEVFARLYACGDISAYEFVKSAYRMGFMDGHLTALRAHNDSLELSLQKTIESLKVGA